MSSVRAAGGGLAQVAVEFARLPTPRIAGRAPAVRSYEAACLEMGDEPWPTEVEQLALQVEGWAVRLCERGLAPTSARRYTGSLVAHARGRGVLWNGRERLLHARVAQLAEDFPHEARRARALDDVMMTKVLAYLGPRAAAGNRHAAMWSALLLLMYFSMLRPGEVCDTALRWWMISERDEGGLQVFLPWRKNKKDSLSRKLDTYAVTQAPAPLDARAAMRRYARLIGAEVGSGNRVVFPRRRVSGRLASGKLLAWINDDLRAIFRSAGVPPPPDFERETSYGLRRGGNTNLGRKGVGKPERGKLGGWRSLEGQEPYDESGGAVADQASARLALAGGAGAPALPGAREGNGRGEKRRWGAAGRK